MPAHPLEGSVANRGVEAMFDAPLAFKTQRRVPRTITLDGYQAGLPSGGSRAWGPRIERLKAIRVRSCQYLNNIVEQDHRAVKRACGPWWD
jgi:transposase-like protein